LQTIQVKQMELGLYKHYKGNMYEVIGIAKHSETLEEMVVYKATYQEEPYNMWVRPKAMFLEKIEINGKLIERFSKISKDMML
jgi:hypothetical protein